MERPRGGVLRRALGTHSLRLHGSGVLAGELVGDHGEVVGGLALLGEVFTGDEHLAVVGGELRQVGVPHIGTVDLAGLPAQLRRDLLIATEGKQVLWDLNAIQDGFTVRGAAGKAPANRSTWANDPARIVELPNAYAFARDSHFSLPVGLIAHRSPTADRDVRMIGAYKWTQDTPGGRQPHVMIVMSIEDGKRAELIMAGIAERGPFWRFVSGAIKDGKLNFVPRDTSGAMVFDWKDAASGSLTVFPASTQSTGRLQSVSFTRLDG